MTYLEPKTRVNANDEFNAGNPAYNQYLLIEMLEALGFLVFVVSVGEDRSIDEEPRLFVGLADRQPTVNEIVEALMQKQIILDPERLLVGSYGNFYEILWQL